MDRLVQPVEDLSVHRELLTDGYRLIDRVRLQDYPPVAGQVGGCPRHRGRALGEGEHLESVLDEGMAG